MTILLMVNGGEYYQTITFSSKGVPSWSSESSKSQQQEWNEFLEGDTLTFGDLIIKFTNGFEVHE